MSTTIDERVVQFEIDNKGFERDAARTKKTLEELDESLKLKNGAKSFKDVEEAAERTNFDSLLKAADAVTHRMSMLGQISERVLENITDKVMATGERLVKSLTLDQLEAGYSKYEQKTQAVQTIMNATGLGIEDVNAQLEKLNWFTDETSYSFIDMVSNIGKFTSQQIGLEESVTAMQGIATWAAKSGQGAAEASRAMYNLSQSMGVGSVKLMDWKSIQNANMATAEFKNLAIETATALAEAANDTAKLNELKEVTVQNFDQSLSSGWFSKDVLMGVLQQYGAYADKVYDFVEAAKAAGDDSMTAADAMRILGDDGFELGASAFRAAQEAKTFTDAIDATKDAVSTGWMTTFETIFGSYDRAKVMWTDLANNLYEVFAGGSAARNDLLGNVFNSSWTKLTRQVSATGLSVTDFVNTLEGTLKDHGQDVEALKEDYGTLGEAFHQGAIPASFISNALVRLANNAEAGAGSAANLEERLSDLNDVAAKFRAGNFGNGDAARQAIEEAGYSYEVVNKLAIRQHAGMATSVEDLQEILDHYGVTLETTSQYTEEEIVAIQELANSATEAGTPMNDLIHGMTKQDGWELLHDTMNNFLETIINFKDAVSEAWSDIFGGERAEKGLYSLLSGMKNFTESLRVGSEDLERFKNICKTLFSILDIGVRTVSVAFSAVGAAFRIVKGIISDILSYFGFVGSAFDAVEAEVDGAVGSVNEALSATKDALDGVDYESFKKNIFDVTKAIGALISWFNRASEVVGELTLKIVKASQPMIDWAQGIYQKYLPSIQAVINVAKDLGDNIYKHVVEPMKNFITEITNSEDPVHELFNRFGEVINILKGFASAFDETLNGEKFAVLKTIISEYMEPFKEALAIIFEKIGSLFANVGASGWMKLLAGGMLLYAIMNITSKLNVLGSLVNGVSDTLLSIKKLAISKTVSPFLTQALALAKALATLAKAVSLLATIPRADLWNAVGAVTVLMVVLAALSFALIKAGKEASPEFIRNMLAIGVSLIAFAAAVLILSQAMSVIAKLELNSWTEVGTALLALFGVMAIAIVGLFAMKKAESGSLAGAVGMLAMSLAMLAVVSIFKVLTLISRTISDEELIKLIGVVVTFAIAMGSLALIRRKQAKGISGLLQFMASLTLLTAAIAMVIGIGILMNKISFGGLLSCIVMFAAVIVGLVGLMWAVQVLTHVIYIDPKEMLELTSSIALLAGAMFVIAAVMLFIDRLIPNPSQYIGTMIGLALVVGAMMLTVAVGAKLADGARGALRLVAAVAALSIVVFMIAVMIKALDKMELSSASAGLQIFKTIMITLGLVMLAIGAAAKMGKTSGIVYVLGLAVVIMSIAAVLILLASQPWSALWPAMVAMGGCLLALGVALLLGGLGLKAASANADKVKAGPILAFMGVVAVIGAVAITLAALNADWKMLTVMFVGMIAMLAVLTIVMKQMAKIESIKAGPILAMAGIMVAMIAIAAAAALVARFATDWKVLLAFFGGMAVAVIALAAAMKILASIKSIKIGPILGMIGVMLAMGVMMSMLAFAISLLPSSDAKEFAITIGIMLGAVLILAVIVGVFGAICGSVPTIVVAMGVLAIVLIAVGAAFLGFAFAINALEEANLPMIASYLSVLAGPMMKIALAGILMILGAIGIVALGGALAVLGATASGAAAGILLADLAINKILLTASAIGSAFATEGSFVDHLANLKDELLNSSAASAELAEATTNLIPNFMQGFNDAAGPAVEDSVGQLTSTAQGAIETSGEEIVGTVDQVYSNEVPEAIASSTSGWNFDIASILGGLDGFDINAMKEKFGGMLGGLGDYDFGSITDIMSGNFSGALDGSFGEVDYTGAAGQVEEGLNTALGSISTTESSSAIGDQWVEGVSTQITSTSNQNKAEAAGLTTVNQASAGATIDTSATGSNFVDGLIKGMNKQSGILYDAARTIATNVEKELKNAWGIKSPSRVAKKIGGYFMEGLQIGFTRNSPELLTHIGTVAEDAVDAVEEILQNDGSEMRITPVLDMTDVYTQLAEFQQSGWAEELKPLMQIGADNPSMKSLNALANMREVRAVGPDDLLTEDGKAIRPTTYNFTQNNYSPKALSRIEIYRQTRNQFSGFKELVK